MFLLKCQVRTKKTNKFQQCSLLIAQIQITLSVGEDEKIKEACQPHSKRILQSLEVGSGNQKFILETHLNVCVSLYFLPQAPKLNRILSLKQHKSMNTHPSEQILEIPAEIQLKIWLFFFFSFIP